MMTLNFTVQEFLMVGSHFSITCKESTQTCNNHGPYAHYLVYAHYNAYAHYHAHAPIMHILTVMCSYHVYAPIMHVLTIMGVLGV